KLAEQRQTTLLVYAIPLALLGLASASSLLKLPFEHGSDLAATLLSAGVALALLAATAAGGFFLWRRSRGVMNQNVTWTDGRVVWAGAPAVGNPRSGWVPAGVDGTLIPVKQP